MEISTDGEKFDEIQSIFISGIVEVVKEHLGEAGLSAENERNLLENISFSVAAITDGSRSVEIDGVEPNPILAFEVDGKLIYSGGSSWLHEYVFGVIAQLYGE